jgi:hypothetical protein
LALFSTTDCSDYNTFEMIVANDDAPSGGVAPEISVCGLTPGETYYFVYDPWSNFETHDNFAIRVQEVSVFAGNDGSITVCTSNDEVDLTTVISDQDGEGMWIFNLNPFAIEDGVFNATLMAVNTYTMEYIVEIGCAKDTSIATVEIVGLASSGTPVSPFNACNTGPVFLFAGLEGTITTGGEWTDNMATGLLQGSIFQANGIPAGMYQFTYTVDNGICPSSSSTVSVNLNNCTGIEENEMTFAVYPNPNNGQFFISSSFTGETIIEVLDMTGKIVLAEQGHLNTNTVYEVNVGGVADGMYIVRIQSENSVSTQSIVIK